MRRSSLILVAVVVLGACDPSSPSQKTVPDVVDDVPDDWAPEARARINDLAADLSETRDGLCTDYTVMSADDYRLGLFTQQHARYIPRAVALCSVASSSGGTGGDAENVEIVLHDSSERRDEFIDERSAGLCDLSQRNEIGLPALRFAVGDDWSVQTDSQAVAIEIGGALGGAYRVKPCGDVTDPDWDVDAVARLDALANRVETAGIDCAFAVGDKDLLRLQRHYAEIGLPGALGSCDATYGDAGSSVLGFVAYADDATPRDQFLLSEFDELCSGGADVRIVAGDGWDLLAVTGPHAELVATATGGSPTSDRCAVVSTVPTTALPVQGPIIPQEP